MAKNIWQRKDRVDKGLFGSKFATTKIEHIDENKVLLQSGNVPTSPPI
jgi:hypothetical protein